jgi:molybdate transport system regulatory protein
MPTLSLRVDLGPDKRIGPGKIALLEHIEAAGSISAGARRMGMSYKHAWDLIEELNVMFGTPIVATSAGGPKGGGAQLTKAGRSIIVHYRAIERVAQAAAAKHLSALAAEVCSV